MPVRVKDLEVYKGSATPSDLNVETALVELPAYDLPVIVEGYVDYSALQSGESAEVRVYLAVDEANQRLYDVMSVSGDDEGDVAHLTSMMVPAGGRLKITVTQKSGTPRTFYYWVGVQVLERI